jgi:hypothetical protein
MLCDLRWNFLKYFTVNEGLNIKFKNSRHAQVILQVLLQWFEEGRVQLKLQKLKNLLEVSFAWIVMQPLDCSFPTSRPVTWAVMFDYGSDEQSPRLVAHERSLLVWLFLYLLVKEAYLEIAIFALGNKLFDLRLAECDLLECIEWIWALTDVLLEVAPVG